MALGVRIAGILLERYAKQWLVNSLEKEKAQFINERNRPDIVVLPDKTTWQITGIESFDPADLTLTQIQHVLLIELKKGGFELPERK